MAEHRLLADIYAVVNRLIPKRDVDSLSDLSDGRVLAKLLKCGELADKPNACKAQVENTLKGFLNVRQNSWCFDDWSHTDDRLLNFVVVVLFVAEKTEKLCLNRRKSLKQEVDQLLVNIRTYYVLAIENMFCVLKQKLHKFKPLIQLNENVNSCDITEENSLFGTDSHLCFANREPTDSQILAEESESVGQQSYENFSIDSLQLRREMASDLQTIVPQITHQNQNPFNDDSNDDSFYGFSPQQTNNSDLIEEETTASEELVNPIVMTTPEENTTTTLEEMANTEETITPLEMALISEVVSPERSDEIPILGIKEIDISEETSDSDVIIIDELDENERYEVNQTFSLSQPMVKHESTDRKIDVIESNASNQNQIAAKRTCSQSTSINLTPPSSPEAVAKNWRKKRTFSEMSSDSEGDETYDNLKSNMKKRFKYLKSVCKSQKKQIDSQQKFIQFLGSRIDSDEQNRKDEREAYERRIDQLAADNNNLKQQLSSNSMLDLFDGLDDSSLINTVSDVLMPIN